MEMSGDVSSDNQTLLVGWFDVKTLGLIGRKMDSCSATWGLGAVFNIKLLVLLVALSVGQLKVSP